MTEDVLEQVVDDWLRRLGYFTRTNVRFGPTKGEDDFISRDHNQASDLDVLAVSPTINGPKRVYAISCKAMQAGFSPQPLAGGRRGGQGLQRQERQEAPPRTLGPRLGSFPA